MDQKISKNQISQIHNTLTALAENNLRPDPDALLNLFETAGIPFAALNAFSEFCITSYLGTEAYRKLRIDFADAVIMRKHEMGPERTRELLRG